MRHSLTSPAAMKGPRAAERRAASSLRDGLEQTAERSFASSACSFPRPLYQKAAIPCSPLAPAAPVGTAVPEVSVAPSTAKTPMLPLPASSA